MKDFLVQLDWFWFRHGTFILFSIVVLLVILAIGFYPTWKDSRARKRKERAEAELLKSREQVLREWISKMTAQGFRQQPILGYVDFYDFKKGFGFLRDKKGGSYYVSRESFENFEAPEAGQYYYFFAQRKIKDKHATVISMTRDPARYEQRHVSAKGASRVMCSACGHTMTPRAVFSCGCYVGSCCPFCGAVYKDPHTSYTDF